mgnify:CR=1 FL=1
MMFIVSKIIRLLRPARCEQPAGEKLNYDGRDDKSMRIIHIKWTGTGIIMMMRAFISCLKLKASFIFKFTEKNLKDSSLSFSIISILCDLNTIHFNGE